MRYLGLDLGTKTLGLSISDKTGLIATSLFTIKHNLDFDYLIEELKKVIIEKEISALVLGFPKNMNNSIGEKGELVLEFKKKLEENFDIPVFLEDERLTTKVAENILIQADMSRKKRKKIIDKVAANVILQSFLDKRKRK